MAFQNNLLLDVHITAKVWSSLRYGLPGYFLQKR